MVAKQPGISLELPAYNLYWREVGKGGSCTRNICNMFLDRLLELSWIGCFPEVWTNTLIVLSIVWKLWSQVFGMHVNTRSCFANFLFWSTLDICLGWSELLTINKAALAIGTAWSTSTLNFFDRSSQDSTVHSHILTVHTEGSWSFRFAHTVFCHTSICPLILCIHLADAQGIIILDLRSWFEGKKNNINGQG